MAKPKDQAFTSLLFLAQVLPNMRQHSEEAASLVEAAIVECTIAMSGSRCVNGQQLDLVAFLRYALEDVATITPAGGALIELAISSLGDKRFTAPVESRYVH